jgi:hypothetical protein
MGLGSPKVIQELDFRDISTVKPGTLGSYAETVDGRGYRLALAGGTTLDPGKLCVAETVDSDSSNRTVARTTAVGATEVIIDAAGAVTADRYVDGYLTINDATGEGISYLVKSNTATTGAAELTVRLYDPIKVGLTIDVSEASLTANPYSGVVISVTDQADLPVGVPNVSITNAYYGWLQTKGVCSVLADEAITAGLALTTGTGVAGAVEALDAAGEPQIGVAIVAGVDTEYREAYLSID